MTISDRSNHTRSLALSIGLVAGVSILLAACNSSSKASSLGSATTASPAAASASSMPSGGSGASNASVTVSASTVTGLGTVLVDGNGRTLYVLASEQGGKVSCTASNGCTAIWPALVLPPGMSRGIAGSGVQASLLGTVKGPAGDMRLTYGGWPLYTFTEDTGSGMAKGQNLTDTWGLWWVLSPSGNPVKRSASGAPTSTAPVSTAPASTAPATKATTPPPVPTTAAPASGGAGF